MHLCHGISLFPRHELLLRSRGGFCNQLAFYRVEFVLVNCLNCGSAPKLQIYLNLATGQMRGTIDLSLFYLHSVKFLRKLRIHSCTNTWLLIIYSQGNSLDSGRGFLLYEFLLNMEQRKLCGAVLLDISLTKALDTVDYGILLRKLSEIAGLCENSVQWFRSYITDRKQRTRCGNELSDDLPVTHGVLQGSILGPLLFVIYIVLDACHASLYADDTVFLSGVD